MEPINLLLISFNAMKSKDWVDWSGMELGRSQQTNQQNQSNQRQIDLMVVDGC